MRAEGKEPAESDTAAMKKLCRKAQKAMDLHGIQQKCEPINEQTLETMTKAVAAAIQKEDKEVRSNRIEEARKEAEGDWSRGGRFTYRKAKPPPPPPTLVVSRPDGSLTAQPQEMQELVSEAWVGPIFCKHGTKPIPIQREGWDKFVNFCGDSLPREQSSLDEAWAIYEDLIRKRQPENAGPDAPSQHEGDTGEYYQMPRLRGERLVKKTERDGK